MKVDSGTLYVAWFIGLCLTCSTRLLLNESRFSALLYYPRHHKVIVIPGRERHIALKLQWAPEKSVPHAVCLML